MASASCSSTATSCRARPITAGAGCSWGLAPRLRFRVTAARHLARAASRSSATTAGGTSAAVLFGEVSLPLVQRDGVVKSFGLELGARYSDYDQQGTSNTYKSLFTLEFGAPVRLRGGWQRANRAPNVGELYAP